MPTLSRKRRNVDMGRLRDALRGPGADTRVWLATARVDDDPDAVTWYADIGWIVDVTFYGGPLDQVDAVPCKLGGSFAQDFATKSDPPGRGCEVLVAITDGDPNSNPVIVARLHNAGGCEVPLVVNQTPITESFALANHIVVTPHGAAEQYGGDRRVTAPNQDLGADDTFAVRGAEILLGGTSATLLTPAVPPASPAVLGTGLQAATTQLVATLSAYAAGLGAVGPPTASVLNSTAIASAAALATAMAAYATAVTAALSGKVSLD